MRARGKGWAWGTEPRTPMGYMGGGWRTPPVAPAGQPGANDKHPLRGRCGWSFPKADRKSWGAGSWRHLTGVRERCGMAVQLVHDTAFSFSIFSDGGRGRARIPTRRGGWGQPPSLRGDNTLQMRKFMLYHVLARRACWSLAPGWPGGPTGGTGENNGMYPGGVLGSLNCAWLVPGDEGAIKGDD